MNACVPGVGVGLASAINGGPTLSIFSAYIILNVYVLLSMGCPGSSFDKRNYTL